MSTSLETKKSGTVATAGSAERARFQPSVNIYETSEEVVLVASMPGASADSIDVDVENGVLTLRGKVADRAPQGARPVLREYAVGDYLRTFALSERIDPTGVVAEFSDGVLALHLPKVAAARPRKIEVTAK